MLKLGTIKFHAKCKRHPNFQPADGIGAVKGGCTRCTQLVEIHDAHQRLTRLIRQFGPLREQRPKPDPDAGRQFAMFE